MIVLCMDCKKQIGEKDGPGVSHGLCEYDNLRRLNEADLATEGERSRLNQLNLERRAPR